VKSNYWGAEKGAGYVKIRNKSQMMNRDNKVLLLPLAALTALFSIFYFLFSNFYPARAQNTVNVGTKFTATTPVVTLTQSDYRWYENQDSLDPGSAMAAEDTTASTPSQGSAVRLRMNILDAQVGLPSGNTFDIQYANSTSGPWTSAASSTAWTFYDNPSVSDGQIIVTTALNNSTVGESYGESNPSAASPSPILSGQRGEWDWVLANNSADTGSDWFFRMIYSSSTVLDSYLNYPKFTAVPPSPPPSPGGGGGGGVISVAAGPTPPPTAKATSTQLPIPPPTVPPNMQCADLNGDGVVNLVDLSILLYHYGETSGTSLSCSHGDLNNDGSVSFDDVSILMYYWTT
jgi:hypothetical protein